MHYYALHYFQRAAALKYDLPLFFFPQRSSNNAADNIYRPLDVRMWSAVGNCYEKLGRFGEAIKAYRRALVGDGALDVAHLLKIAELYERAGDIEAAKRQFKACVKLAKTDSSMDVSQAHEWLERYMLDQERS